MQLLNNSFKHAKVIKFKEHFVQIGGMIVEGLVPKSFLSMSVLLNCMKE